MGTAPDSAVRRIRWTTEPEKLEFCMRNDTGTVDQLSAAFEERFGFPLSRPQVILFRQRYGRTSRRSPNWSHERSSRTPVGFIRYDSKKGYAVVKVREQAEKHGTKDNWKPITVVAWESYQRKELPDGYVVMAADGNAMNVHPDNLVAVPKRLMGIMNNKFAGWRNREELELAVAQAELHSQVVAGLCRKRKCSVCGEEFEPIHHMQARNQKTCPKCVAEGHRTPELKPKGTRHCVVCGDEFTYHKKSDRRCRRCIEAGGNWPIAHQKRQFAKTGRRGPDDAR